MSGALRLFLFFGAIISFFVVIKNIRKSRMLIADCLCWFFIGFLGLLLALFPQISFSMSKLLGIESPVNLVFLFLILLLLLLTFKQTIRISELEVKIRELTQDITIERNKK